MDASHRIRGWALLCFALFILPNLRAQEEFAVHADRAETGLELRWQVYFDPGATPPVFEIQRSVDMIEWTTVATNLTSANGVLRLVVAQDDALAFYRVKSNQQFSLTASNGEELFGYSRALKQRLAQLGQISVDTFAALFPVEATYLDRIDFDVTKVAYWKELNSAPPPPTWPNIYLRDFTLNATEKTALQKNGFMVSGRLSSTNFIGLYYDIFTRDLPVLVTSDSMLHAWHRSYDAILQDLETTYLSKSLEIMLQGMASAIPSLWQDYGNGPLAESVLDADYFIAVALSLLGGSQVNSALNQEAWVAQTLNTVQNLTVQHFNLFGRLDRDPEYLYDFSQFKPRGHYTESVFLQRYFRAMMWCGRTDLRVAGNAAYASPRELGTAMVLLQSLKSSGRWPQWQAIDQMIEVLVGRVDSMTFAQLDGLLASAPVKSLNEVKSLDDLARIQTAIETGALGFQDVHSDLFYSPLSAAQVKLPSSFTVLGQRFTMDSWALSSVVFDRILWRTNAMPSLEDKVQRRIPSCLDVAFSVFANNQVMPELLARLSNPNGRAFRDGLPYQHNLAAVRQVIDSQSAEAWKDNVYNAWLGALRELSPPTTSPAFPQCMRTRAWAMKMLNTQLGSWTHLRHDTILYVKQSYTEPMTCVYPAGFVEPVPAFWAKMNFLATRMRDVLSSITMTGAAPRPDRYQLGVTFSTDLALAKSKQLIFLQRFADTMTTLQTLAAKELRQEPFAPNEIDFLKDVVERHVDYFGIVTYSGWFPKLYYWDNEGFDAESDALAASRGLVKLPHDSEKWDALVADVHTDSPDAASGDPGMVLHEGVGNVNCLVAAIDSGPDRAIYLGPVLSHYEFEQPAFVRLSDEDWRAKLSKGLTPPPPEWTRDYFLP